MWVMTTFYELTETGFTAPEWQGLQWVMACWRPAWPWQWVMSEWSAMGGSWDNYGLPALTGWGSTYRDGN